ncbi:hypothetical protein B0H14DRAFT_3515336 [Mycena olivaceomarginata]|nr:hypothetical protein B0H14DRAFT_3515336 [Mycena olivaceomarginata]
MSTVEDVPANGSTWTPVEAKKDPKSKRHAEAQERYREKNLETTRAKARERMQRLRANRTPEQVLKASENRRSSDADYNEHRRRLCAPSFENYKNDNEHDANPRKHWYLILGVGLFTKKCVQKSLFRLRVAYSAGPTRKIWPLRTNILIFFKKSHALRRWKRHCMRRHTEDDHSNPRHCSDPDDGEDDGDDAESVADTPPRAHSAAPECSRQASTPAPVTRLTRTTLTTDMPPLLYGVEGDQEGINCRDASYYVTRDQLDRSGVQSVTPANPLGQTSPAAKLPPWSQRLGCAAGQARSAPHRLSASLQPSQSSASTGHWLSARPQLPRSPKYPCTATCPDSELTDREVDQGDVFMAPASPVPMPPTISPTASTVSSLSSDSSDLGVSSSVRPAAPQMGAAGPSSRSMGLGESISGARHAPRQMGAAPPSSISSPGAGAPAASTGTSSMRVLFNSTTHWLYPDPMQVFAEVNPGELLQVVGQEEVVEYCAGQSARLGS